MRSRGSRPSVLGEWADHNKEDHGQEWPDHSALHRSKDCSEDSTSFLFGQKHSFAHSLIHSFTARPLCASVLYQRYRWTKPRVCTGMLAFMRHSRQTVAAATPRRRGPLPPHRIVSILCCDCIGVKKNTNQAEAHSLLIF